MGNSLRKEFFCAFLASLAFLNISHASLRFSYRGGGAQPVVRTEPKSGKSDTLHIDKKFTWGIAPSPDHSLILFRRLDTLAARSGAQQTDNSTLVLIDSSGNEVIEYPQGSGFACGFAPDGKSFAFISGKSFLNPESEEVFQSTAINIVTIRDLNTPLTYTVDSLLPEISTGRNYEDIAHWMRRLFWTNDNHLYVVGPQATYQVSFDSLKQCGFPFIKTKLPGEGVPMNVHFDLSPDGKFIYYKSGSVEGSHTVRVFDLLTLSERTSVIDSALGCVARATIGKWDFSVHWIESSDATLSIRVVPHSINTKSEYSTTDGDCILGTVALVEL